jgi:hypothetical protein
VSKIRVTIIEADDVGPTTINEITALLRDAVAPQRETRPPPGTSVEAWRIMKNRTASGAYTSHTRDASGNEVLTLHTAVPPGFGTGTRIRPDVKNANGDTHDEHGNVSSVGVGSRASAEALDTAATALDQAADDLGHAADTFGRIADALDPNEQDESEHPGEPSIGEPYTVAVRERPTAPELAQLGTPGPALDVPLRRSRRVPYVEPLRDTRVDAPNAEAKAPPLTAFPSDPIPSGRFMCDKCAYEPDEQPVDRRKRCPKCSAKAWTSIPQPQ